MSAKGEALKAIDHVIGMLADGDLGLGLLQRRLAKATLEHAKEQVAEIQELKRQRRTKAPVA